MIKWLGLVIYFAFSLAKLPHKMNRIGGSFLFKTADNCYTQKLLSEHKKNPQPRMLMLTLKRVKEMFPYFEDIEYKVASDENNKI